MKPAKITQSLKKINFSNISKMYAFCYLLEKITVPEWMYNSCGNILNWVDDLKRKN